MKSKRYRKRHLSLNEAPSSYSLVFDKDKKEDEGLLLKETGEIKFNDRGGEREFLLFLFRSTCPSRASHFPIRFCAAKKNMYIHIVIK